MANNKTVINLPSEMHFPSGTPPVKVIDLSYTKHTEIMHMHDFYEIVLVKSGSGKHITEKGAHSIFHGDIFLIKPGQAHTYYEIKKLKIVNIIYLPSAMDFDLYGIDKLAGYKLFFESGPVSGTSCFDTPNLNAEHLNTANEIILEMSHHQQKQQEGYEYFMRLGLMRLVGLISISCSGVDVSRNDEVTKLVRVLRFIETRYQEKIQINELAAIAGLSPSSLLRAFREEVGETPINYLINLRLEKAAKMLRETTESVSQISYLVGIHDSNYFSKMFKRKYLCSPRKYRLTSKNK